MPPAQRTSTTRLPAALREQIDQTPTQNTRRHKPVVNRKLARKQERQEQKQRKANFFSHPKGTSLKRPPEDYPEQRPKKKSRPLSASSPVPVAPQLTKKISSTKSSLKVGDSIRKHSDDLISGPRKPATSRHHPNPSIEDADDTQIAWLESKLGVVRGGNGQRKSSLRFEDGLDDLMDDLDRIIPRAQHGLTTPESENEEDQEDSEFEGFSVTTEEKNIDNMSPDIERNTDASGLPFGPVEEEMESGDTESKRKDDAVVAVDAHASSVDAGSRYIPPHLRSSSSEGSESLSKLSRQLKGLLNRVSEQNMASILTAIEELYRTHRRNDISSTLTDLVIGGISSHSSLLDSFVVLHASLVASLHKIIRVDFAAHFVQCLVASYEQHYHALRAGDFPEAIGGEAKGKECLNLMVLLSELYNLQVISCILIYDLIRGLLDRLDEFDVELLLKVARNSGQQLRQDDPSALKDIIQIVQSKMSEKEQSTISSRTHFMVETLTNLKNNKGKRIVGQDGHSESLERMRKFLSGLSKKHHVLAHEPLRVTLDDLHSSEKKGKWWLVGSAWGGDPLIDRVQTEGRQAMAKDAARQTSDALLKLARKQGMNTDVRRSIFVVLMSSDDYIDACERLSQLSLTEIQQREVVRVILHCLGNEKLYNPYYTLVVQQLCQTSHSNKVTLQFCLWDFLRGLGEKGVGGVEIIKNLPNDDSHVAFDVKKVSSTRLINVARAYAWWIAKGCSSLTILKPVDFTVLQSQSRDFLRTFFLQLFISSQVSSPVIAPNDEAAEYLTGSRSREAIEEIFLKATRLPDLTQGLIYFLTTALRGDDRLDGEIVSGMLKWAREVAKDTLRTGMDVVASLT